MPVDEGDSGGANAEDGLRDGARYFFAVDTVEDRMMIALAVVNWAAPCGQIGGGQDAGDDRGVFHGVTCAE